MSATFHWRLVEVPDVNHGRGVGRRTDASWVTAATTASMLCTLHNSVPSVTMTPLLLLLKLPTELLSN